MAICGIIPVFANEPMSMLKTVRKPAKLALQDVWVYCLYSMASLTRVGLENTLDKVRNGTW